MDALLAFLDFFVAELEYYLELKTKERLDQELDYLQSISFLDEIRQPPEYQSIRANRMIGILFKGLQETFTVILPSKAPEREREY